MRQRLIDGLYVFYKPVGISSAGFLSRIKKRYAILKIGHGGTLDPFADGVLVVGVGREYTRQLSIILKKTTKEYEASIVLGASSSTDDATGEIEQRVCVAPPTHEAIKRACGLLQERTEQIPPRFSAVKVGGIPAYAHARRGNTVALETKEATMYSFSINDIREKGNGTMLVDVTLTVSSGFYVRSFARDLGEILGVGGYVQTLRRTRVGDFSLVNALKWEDAGGGTSVKACAR
ncbi:MAG: tRNA pseudouridine(55) synthase TruB [Candidatus Paceibacterota bacterium]|jgi:tRNA pseudouridine55 synthase